MDDTLELVDCRITNAVRCVPPENKPIGAEINACRDFLLDELVAQTSSQAAPSLILTLGGIAHGSTLRALGLKPKVYPFSHGAFYELGNGKVLASSYHCSRYNVNTGRLTTDMFEAIVREVRARLS